MIQVASENRLPFIFKDVKSGYVLEKEKLFVAGEFKQSLTDYQIETLKIFDVSKTKSVFVPETPKPLDEKPEGKEGKEDTETKDTELKVKTNVPKQKSDKNKKGKK